jgi:hypothetical protein
MAKNCQAGTEEFGKKMDKEMMYSSKELAKDIPPVVRLLGLEYMDCISLSSWPYKMSQCS